MYMYMDLGSIVRKAAKPIVIAGAATYMFLNTVIPVSCTKPEPIANPQYTNNPSLQTIPTPAYTPTPSPELAPQPIPTPSIIPQPLHKNKIGFDEVPSGWPAPLFVTDRKDSLESKMEFEFGSDVYLNFSVSEKILLNQLDYSLGLYKIIIDYILPNGKKITIKESHRFISDTNGEIKFNSDNFNLKEYLGTSEAGRHTLEATLIIPHLDPKSPSREPEITTVKSISFKVLEPPIITVDGTQKLVYTQEEWNYFQEIAFGSEYGNIGKTIVKWSKQNPPMIFVRGSVVDENIKPSQESMSTLKEVVEELRKLTNLDIQFTDEPSKANFSVYLDVPHSDLHKIFPEVKTTIIDSNSGLFYFMPDINSNIYQAVSAVSRENQYNNEILPRKTIDKLIREEMTQALGLANDSYKYPLSIFQQNNSFANQYFLPIDKKIIRLLYQPEVRPGMGIDQVRELIEVIK